MLVADLHIHSRFSRATSRDLTVPTLSLWAARKGVGLLGTGDFTHPEWLAELEAGLVDDGSGFFRPGKDADGGVASRLPRAVGAPSVRFVLQTEISCIYKAGDKTRKVHNLVYFPDFESARRFNARLARIGNLNSDGRPILGLDSRDLLEIALESCADTIFIPAHIWTPWFSALGSKSGFDSIDECYRDLSGHIHAVETGLSSDPPMNWRVPSLDRFRLVSSSDAHSPSRLAREATLFDELPDWAALKRALATGDGYRGTLEFYPEEGKYHLDGHRKCQTRLEPEDTRRLDGCCPVCGKAVTVGVLHRVHELAGKERERRPPTAAPFESLVALDEILAEVNGVSSRTSKRVLAQYEALLDRFGDELTILRELPLEDLAGHAPRLVEALERVRSGNIHVEGGYDGEFGIVKVFPPTSRVTSASLFPPPAAATENKRTGRPSDATPAQRVRSAGVREPVPTPGGLSDEQAAIVKAPPGRHLVCAGPGSGKTRVLTERLLHLLQQGVPAERTVVVTFTRKAAGELRRRLAERGAERGVTIGTFHSLALSLLNRLRALCGRGALAVCGPDDLALLRAEGIEEAELAATLADLRLVDLESLVPRALTELTEASSSEQDELLACDALLVDEFQDIDPDQFALVAMLAERAGEVLVIGDPNQSIYGFRGGSPRFFERFEAEHGATRWTLTRNFRSASSIRAAAALLLGAQAASTDDALPLVVSATVAAEAEHIAHTVEQLVGGTASFSFNSGRVESATTGRYSFDDIAVLTRTSFAAAAIEEALVRLGVPVSRPAEPPEAAVRLSAGFEAALRYSLNQADRLAALRLKHWDTGGVPLNISKLVRLVRRFRGSDYGELADALFAMLCPEPSIEVRLVFEELRRNSAEPAVGLGDWQAHLATLNEPERFGWRKETVHLLTMHGSKGLEFDVVFVAGLEEGLLPYALGGHESEPDEERRLFYVALTRARREVILSRSRSRTVFGQRREPSASPLLAPLTPVLDEIQNRAARRHKPKLRPAPRRLL